MVHVETSIEVDVAVSEAYCQWTRFDEFPNFMANVKRVRPLADGTLQWKIKIGGRRFEWTASITQQEPDRRITWQSIRGARNHGSVGFGPLAADRTRVSLQLDYEPAGILERVARSLGVVAVLLDGELRRFKSFTESRIRARTRSELRRHNLGLLKKRLAE